MILITESMSFFNTKLHLIRTSSIQKDLKKKNCHIVVKGTAILPDWAGFAYVVDFHQIGSAFIGVNPSHFDTLSITGQ